MYIVTNGKPILFAEVLGPKVGRLWGVRTGRAAGVNGTCEWTGSASCGAGSYGTFGGGIWVGASEWAVPCVIWWCGIQRAGSNLHGTEEALGARGCEMGGSCSVPGSAWHMSTETTATTAGCSLVGARSLELEACALAFVVTGIPSEGGAR